MTMALRPARNRRITGAVLRRVSQAWQTSGVMMMTRESASMPSRCLVATLPSIFPTVDGGSSMLRQDSFQRPSWSLAKALVGYRMMAVASGSVAMRWRT